MRFIVYILECTDHSLYTGITWNLTKRLLEHKKGLTPFTKNRLPVRLLHTEEFTTRIDAAKREKEIKGWSRVKKLKYIEVYAEKQRANKVYVEELSDETGTSSVG